MNLPRNEDYSKPEYWEKRYISEEEYEWLGGFQCYKSILQKYLSKHQQSDSILQLGCGNSSFSTDLRNEGWENITNIDISLTGLQKLRRRERDSNYVLMDMSIMSFKDKAFDIVVEKCTLDSLLVTAESPWDLDSKQHKLVGRVLKEIKRILNPGGTFISITFSQPHFRVPLLLAEGLGWSVQVEKIEG
ncbi:methyltransferase-like protein 13 isoform X2 [Eurytemora carolleeae]|nr:methyltransferase-like protein 13 isoform X2 [Eurytemora carolleeae]|eukprot:XP_023330813.1 methyltransferase-like protein 13 isoform X2 [Eurytemora affinis]